MVWKGTLIHFFKIFWWCCTIRHSKHSPWWRRLEDVFRLHLQKTYSRHFQDVLIKTNIFASLICLQKTSSRRLDQDKYICLGHTSSRLLKTSPRRLQVVLKTSSRHLRDVFKTFWRLLQDVFKTSPKRLGKMSSRRFQDVSSS